MKLKSGCFLQYLRLDAAYRLLSVRNTAALAEYFQLLDVHQKNYLNNLQFYCFLRYVTSLTKDQIMLLFDSLDGNTRNRPEKRFVRWHAGPALQLLGVDRDGVIDFSEFGAARFLFNIQKEELKEIFKDFDISGDKVKLEKLQSKDRP